MTIYLVSTITGVVCLVAGVLIGKSYTESLINEFSDRVAYRVKWMMSDVDKMSCVNPTCKRRKPVNKLIEQHLKAIGESVCECRKSKQVEEPVFDSEPTSLCQRCEYKKMCENECDCMVNCDDFKMEVRNETKNRR
jgi:hypothetical protein